MVHSPRRGLQSPPPLSSFIPLSHLAIVDFTEQRLIARIHAPVAVEVAIQNAVAAELLEDQRPFPGPVTAKALRAMDYAYPAPVIITRQANDRVRRY